MTKSQERNLTTTFSRHKERPWREFSPAFAQKRELHVLFPVILNV